MKTSRIVPNDTLWTPEVQRAYIRQSLSIYISRAGNPSPFESWHWGINGDLGHYAVPAKILESLISELFKEGRVLNILRLSYQEFRFEILGKRRKVRSGHGRYSYKTGWAKWKPSSRFRKTELTEKKSDRDQARSDWRSRKGFDRPRCTYSRNCPKFWKKMAASQRRSHERGLIAKKDWDNLVTETKRDFIDPLRWD